MVLKGVKMLPPQVTTKEALALYKEIAKIKSKIGRLNAEFKHSIVDQNIIQIFSLQESVQSTRIEGTQVTFADMIEQATTENKSKEVIEVLNYQKALNRGIELLKAGNPISSRMIKELHAILMSGETRGTTSASGEYRTVQNFLGKDNKIENAVYIPVSPECVPDYMTNLEYYINGEKHPSFNIEKVKSDDDEKENLIVLSETEDPLIKTAIIHAQFESIHPFLDGNGRLGRILIILCFMMDDLIDFPVFFISEELEKERLRYYNRLNGTRGDNPDWYGWIKFFLSASHRMADSLLEKLDKIHYLAEEGIDTIDSQNSTVNRLWLYTFSKPFFTAKQAADELGISPQTARNHLNTLSEKRLLEVDQSKKRNQLFINYDLLSILR